MRENYQVSLLTEAESLATLRSFESKKSFAIRSTYTRLGNLYDYNMVMAPLILRAKILLQLQYPNVQFDYIDSKSHYSFFAYLPDTGMLIDYFESPWHRGPNGIARSFNPANAEDLAFHAQYSRKQHTQSGWMYRAKALTWSGSDYRKLQYAKFNKLPYYIYWTLQSIESVVDPELVALSHQIMRQQYLNVRLQSVLDIKLTEYLKEWYSLSDISIPHLLMGDFCYQDTIPALYCK